MRDSQLEEMKKNYDGIEIPPELKVMVERGIKQAKADSIRQEQQTKNNPPQPKTFYGLLAVVLVIGVIVCILLIP